jgi:hypothetical protein
MRQLAGGRDLPASSNQDAKRAVYVATIDPRHLPPLLGTDAKPSPVSLVQSNRLN